MYQFSAVPAPQMSKQYVHIDTNRVIDMMAEEGFKVVDVKFDRARQRNPAFIRHMVTFEHDLPDVRPDVRPRSLFINSHNGTCRATTAFGLIRWACMNGCIVGDRMQLESTKHIGDTARELIERMKAMAKNSAPLFQRIEQWERHEMTPLQAYAFAQRAAELRWGDKAGAYDPADLLTTRRDEDAGMDLWRVYNRVQENATHGGFQGRAASGRRIVARRLNGITLDTKFNQELWNLAEAVIS